MAEKKSKNDNKSKKQKSKLTGAEAALERKQKKSSAKKKALIGVCIFLAVLLFLVGGFILAANAYLNHMIGKVTYAPLGTQSWEEPSDTSEDIPFETSTDIAPAPTPEVEEPYENVEGWFDGTNISADYENEVINVLLLGADTLNGRGARSDTMMLMSINPHRNRIVFTSFMRDSYVEIPGRGYNRLNASYSKGGPQLTIDTIEYNFGIDIDYYATVSFDSFRGAIDAINGIDLVVNDVNYNYFYDWPGIYGLSEEEATDGNHTVHLDGEDALLYARTRKGHRVDGSDFGRTLHQRDLITQLVSSCKNASLGEIHGLLEAVLPYISTDMPQDTIKSYVLNALEYLSYNISDARVPCEGSWENATLESGAQVLNINVAANSQYVKAKIYG